MDQALDESTPPQRSRRRPAASRGWASRTLRRVTLPLARVRVPRFAGSAALLAFLLGVSTYGIVRGDHIATIQAAIKDGADAAANAAGMRIATVSLSGQRQVSREEIFVAAGVTDRSSLLFLDVADARTRLEAIPWIAEATVRKLYPDRLQITVTEREAFALWQQQGKVHVIAADGTVLAAKVEPRLAALPFVVGNGAAVKARDFLAVLDRYPSVRDQVRAAILVADRRWNLRLKNGIDVRLLARWSARSKSRAPARRRTLNRDIRRSTCGFPIASPAALRRGSLRKREKRSTRPKAAIAALSTISRTALRRR